MHLEIDEVIAHDEKVVTRFTNSGTNVERFLTNRAVTEAVRRIAEPE
jgi:hypothetical protein